MPRRTPLMYTEICCFVLCLCGWILVCSTLPTEYWTYSEVGSLVLTSSHYFSNLWKDCLSDSTGVSDCKVFPSLLALQTYIHLCRSLIIISIVLGFSGSVLALVGMKCTKFGGSEALNAKLMVAAGIQFFVSGLCGMFAYSWYGHKVVSEFMNPNYKGKKFELGAALFVGWGGSALLVIGGLVFCFVAANEGCQSSWQQREIFYHTASSISQQSQKTHRSSLATIPTRVEANHAPYRPARSGQSRV